MKFELASSLLLIALVAFAGAIDNPTQTPVDPEIVTDDAAKNEPTTQESKTSSSTSTSTTTTTTTTTTTSKPTEAPVTTTTVAPAPITTTAPPPTPTPNPDMGKWSYGTNNQDICIIVQAAMQLNFNYTNTDGKVVPALYNVPANRTTVANGACDKTSNSINLKWDNDNHLDLVFTLNTTTSHFYLAALNFQINVSAEFPNAKAGQNLLMYHVGDNFTAPLDMSYHCQRVQTLKLTKNHAVDDLTIVGYVNVSKVQFEAFHRHTGDTFSTAKDCDAIDTPDIVPIAVGCALAALVIVVLIAYLVGRRRAQARGYLSM